MVSLSGACTTTSSASHCFLPSVCVSQTSAADNAAIALADRTANALCRGELALLIGRQATTTLF
jgi:hypothetical protein